MMRFILISAIFSTLPIAASKQIPSDKAFWSQLRILGVESREEAKKCDAWLSPIDKQAGGDVVGNEKSDDIYFSCKSNCDAGP